MKRSYSGCIPLICDFEEQGLAAPVDPKILAASHGLWAREVHAYAPWKEVDYRDPAGRIAAGRAWRSSRGERGPSVIICGECGSGMDVAWRLIEAGSLKPWDSVLALSQKAGRGQYKRSWVSPPGNIYAAWRWPDADSMGADGMRWLALTPLLAGYMLAKAMERLGLAVRIKWPNDLLIGERKFGGVLAETRSNRRLIGIGLNVSSSPGDRLLRNDFALPATHLLAHGFEATPLHLWLKLVEKGKSLFEEIIYGMTPENFISALCPCIAWVGSRVMVKTADGRVFVATVSGLSQDGGLRLKSNGKEQTLYAGSILPA